MPSEKKKKFLLLFFPRTINRRLAETSSQDFSRLVIAARPAQSWEWLFVETPFRISERSGGCVCNGTRRGLRSRLKSRPVALDTLLRLLMTTDRCFPIDATAVDDSWNKVTKDYRLQ